MKEEIINIDSNINWDEEKGFQDHDSIFEGLINDIKESKKSIEIEMFIFNIDDLGRVIIRELKKASKRGVSVRIIVDGIGSPMFTEKIIKNLNEHGIKVKVYKPISQFIANLKQSITSNQPNKILHSFFNMNIRNHRKIYLIDSEIGWVGSANISSNYSNWRETMVRVKGKNVKKIRKGFNFIWSKLCDSFHHKKITKIENKLISQKFSNIKNDNKDNLRIKAIDSAKKSIKIVNPYFIPPYSLLIPLLRASKRGVVIELMTSDRADYCFTKWFSRSYYKVLLKQGIKIYEQNKQFIHSKVLIIDDSQAVIGTSNYNYRSLHCDLEIDILVEKKETINFLLEQWVKDIGLSDRIIDIKTAQFWNKFIKILSPLKKIS